MNRGFKRRRSPSAVAPAPSVQEAENPAQLQHGESSAQEAISVQQPGTPVQLHDAENPARLLSAGPAPRLKLGQSYSYAAQLRRERIRPAPDWTTQTTPRIEADPGGSYMAERPPVKSRRIWRNVALAAIFAVVVAVATYRISSAVSPIYQSTAQLRIVVNEANGLGQDSLQASDDLTAQLVQLVPTDSVLTAPARQLGMSVSALNSSLSVGTVAQQNLMQITANAPSASEAQRRAATITSDFKSFMVSDAQRQLASYVGSLSREIQRMNATEAQIAAKLRTATGGNATVLGTELGSIISQQQSLRSQLTQREATTVPVIQQVQAAGVGSKVSPRPTLYAIVALLVAGFVAAQIVVLTERRRRAAL
jgi:capsular polysaccharide biosynthesis protein